MKDAKNTILYVDDDRFQLNSMQQLLKAEYNILLCKTGKEGIAAYKDNRDKIKAAILDIRLPDMDGFEIFRQIRDINMEVPIIFITAYQDKYDTIELLQTFRPHGYIIKNGANELQSIRDTIKAAVAYYDKILELEQLKIERLSQEIEKKFISRLSTISRDIQNEMGQ